MYGIDVKPWVDPLVRVGIALCAAAVLAAPPSQAAVRTIDESRPASATGSVDIESLSGSVSITGWDQPRVTIKGKMDEEATLEFTGTENQTSIRVKWPKDGFLGRQHDGVCDLQIQVPLGSDVSAHTVSADISADGVKGELELETVSGEVSARGEPGPVRAKSVSGNVRILAATHRVTAESVSGNVTLQGPDGEAKISNVSGAISVAQGSFKTMEVNTVSGDLQFQGDPAPGARFEISSHSGAVELDLPASTSADFNVNTFSGEITTDFGGTPSPKSQYAPGSQLQFTAGSGDARIEVNTFSGDVRLRKR